MKALRKLFISWLMLVASLSAASTMLIPCVNNGSQLSKEAFRTILKDARTGQMSSSKIENFVVVHQNTGIFFHLTPSELTKFKNELNFMSDKETRYMSENKPIQIKGVLDGSGKRIGQVIRSLGETAPKGVLGLIGPLHTHDTVHITTVTQGSGTFYMELELGILVSFEMTVGDVIIIPKGIVHTFHSGQRSTITMERLWDEQNTNIFEVVTIASEPKRGDSKGFAKLIGADDELKLSANIITYSEYLKSKYFN